jgi:hypothetical protein
MRKEYGDYLEDIIDAMSKTEKFARFFSTGLTGFEKWFNSNSVHLCLPVGSYSKVYFCI